MRTISALTLLMATTVGCEGLHHRKGICNDSCVTECPAPKPVCEPACPIPCPPAAGPSYGAAPAPAPSGPVYGAAPAGPVYGAAPALPAPGSPIVNTEIKEHNSVGFEFTTIKLPLPWLKLKVTPLGYEVTHKTRTAPSYGAAPAPAPAPTYGAMPFAAGQMVYTGTQYVPQTGYHTVQVPAVPPPGPTYGAAPPPVVAPPLPPCDPIEFERMRIQLKEFQDKEKAAKGGN